MQVTVDLLNVLPLSRFLLCQRIRGLVGVEGRRSEQQGTPVLDLNRHNDLACMPDAPVRNA